MRMLVTMTTTKEKTFNQLAEEDRVFYSDSLSDVLTEDFIQPEENSPSEYSMIIGDSDLVFYIHEMQRNKDGLFITCRLNYVDPLDFIENTSVTVSLGKKKLDATPVSYTSPTKELQFSLIKILLKDRHN